jgi:dipeptidase E
MTVLSTTPHRHLLLLSNSRNPGGGFLDHAEDALRDFLRGRQRVLFVPFAGVAISWALYTQRVRDRLARLDVDVDGLHDAPEARRAVEEADALMVGGGNTWQLLRELQRGGLLAPLAARINEGVRYVGWSAGANIACPSIRTTNDMPIVEVESFAALGVVPFQINPHYTDGSIPGHGGETRPERIAEFLAVNPGTAVVGLPEGAWLRVDGPRLALYGRDAVLFRGGAPPERLAVGPIEVARLAPAGG